MAEADLIDDARELMADAGLAAPAVDRIARELRHRWQGQIYVRSRDSVATDEQIRTALAAGEKTADIAKRIGVARSTVTRKRSRWLG